MELVDIVTGFTKRGIHLGINAGNIRVWPIEKLTNEDRDLLKEYKKPLLDMLDLQENHPRSERCEHREPNFKDYSREKKQTEDGYIFFSENKVKTNVHNVHYVHDFEVTPASELRKLGDWLFGGPSKGFDQNKNFNTYNAGTHKLALSMLKTVRDLTWPDFEVYVDKTFITFKRVKEKYFPIDTLVDNEIKK